MSSTAASGAAGAGAAGVERTLALVKPDACGAAWIDELVRKVPPPEDGGAGGGDDGGGEGKEPEAVWEPAREIRSGDKASEILKRIAAAGFRVVQQRVTHLSKAEAEGFYAEHAGKPFFDKLTGFMSSGPTLALVLERENAVKEWRALMGPTNSLKAREAAEAAHPLNEELWSLRALYGTDGTRNATHGSDGAHSAAREIAYFFPPPHVFERSVAVVLPRALAAGKSDAVVAALEAADFAILARRIDMLPKEAAAAALGDAAATPEAVAAATAGPAEVILVERVGAVPRLAALVGSAAAPLSVAKGSFPATLRAQLGVSDADGGVVAPTSAEAAAEVARLAFPTPLAAETTLAVIKPGTADEHYRAIVNDVLAAGFTIVAETRRRLTKEEAEAFYAEHRGRPFFERLTTYMASGPVVALALSKVNAIKLWRQAMGPTKYADKPTCMRFRYARDDTRNALHGSDSPASAARELRFYFPFLHLDASLTGAEAVKFIREAVMSHVYDPTRGAIVPKTLEGVVVDALAALARVKPSSDPADAIRWLGAWLVDNNPRRGHARVPGDAPRAGPRVSEPEDAPAPPSTSAGAAGAGAGAGGPARPLPAGNRTIVFVLGGPGSGKGTQCERIAKTFGYAHLSTGDLLRAELASGSALGAQLESTMKAGKLVSDDVVLTLLTNAMAAAPGSRFLIDGYPRSLTQALEFERTVGAPTFVLSFDAREEVLEARLLERGRSSGRADDNAATIRARFKTFAEQSAPVIDFYGKLGLLRQVNSERPIAAVFDAVQPHFRPQLVWVLGPAGSGRTTLCRRLQDARLGYQALSLDALVAAEIAAGSALGNDLAARRARGDVIPTASVAQLVRGGIEAAGPVGRYVLDGLPRNREEAAALEAEWGKPDFVVHVDVAEPVLVARALAAKTDAATPYVKQKAVRDGVKRKHAHFHADVAPIIATYAKQARVRVVAGDASPDAVFAAFRRWMTPEMVFVLGGPGVGKGTQCQRIAAEFGWTHLSAGDLLRAEIVRRSPNGTMIEGMMKEGKIVPAAVTLELLRAAIVAARTRAVLIDGFPREMTQAAAFEATIGEASFVLFFDAAVEVMQARLTARARVSGRPDDNPETALKRFKTYVEETMPVINHYAALGKVRTIDAAPAPDAVFAAVRPLFAPHVVLVLGLPGSGKGVQCANIVQRFGFTHLSTGDLLRAEAASGGAAGEALAATMASGGLVSDDVTLHLLRDAMAHAPNRKFLLDGYPRSLAQAEALEALVGRPALAIVFDAPRDVIKARLIKRGATSGRKDDNEATITKRFATYDEQSAPVIERYRAAGLVRTIDALPAPDTVFASVRTLLQPQLAILVGAAGSGRHELAVRAGKELGYHTLRVTDLLKAEVAAGTPLSKPIADAMAAKRTVPTDLTLRVVQAAIARSTARRFMLDGFPRTVAVGLPAIHDQVFDLEAAVGVVRGCVVLDATMDARLARTKAKSPSEVAALAAAVQTFQREKTPAAVFFSRVGKAAVIDTSALAPDDVYEAARPYLE